MKDWLALRITNSPSAHGMRGLRFYFTQASWRYITTGPDFLSKIIACGRGYTASPSLFSGRSTENGAPEWRWRGKTFRPIGGETVRCYLLANSPKARLRRNTGKRFFS